MHIDNIELAEPFMSLFPRRTDLEAEIAEDMERDGFDEAFPLIVWDHILVDGYHRYYAADKCRIHTLPVVEKDFDSEDEAVLYGIRANARRRHLSDAELVGVVLEVDKRNRAIKERIRLANLNHHPKCSDSDLLKCSELNPKCSESNVQQLDTRTPQRSAKETAIEFGVTENKIDNIRAIHEHGTEEDIQEVKDGKITIHKKAEEIRNKKRTPAKKITPVDYRTDAQKDFDNAYSALVNILVKFKRDNYEGVSHTLIRQEIQKLVDIVRTQNEMEGNNDELN